MLRDFFVRNYDLVRLNRTIFARRSLRFGVRYSRRSRCVRCCRFKCYFCCVVVVVIVVVFGSGVGVAVVVDLEALFAVEALVRSALIWVVGVRHVG